MCFYSVLLIIMSYGVLWIIMLDKNIFFGVSILLVIVVLDGVSNTFAFAAVAERKVSHINVFLSCHTGCILFSETQIGLN